MNRYIEYGIRYRSCSGHHVEVACANYDDAMARARRLMGNVPEGPTLIVRTITESNWRIADAGVGQRKEQP